MKWLSKGKTKYIITAVIVLLLGSAGLIVSLGHNGSLENEKHAKYHCPMHPTYTSDRPGDCPICGMKLVPIEAAPEANKDASSGKKIRYKSTMNPNEVSDVPGKDSMGMEMVPFEVEENSRTAVSGQAVVNIPVEQQRLIGIKTEKIKNRELQIAVRAAGRVAHDPELFNGMAEYKKTLEVYEDLKSRNTSADIMKQTEDLLNSSRDKLYHMGISEKQVSEISSKSKDDLSILYTSKAIKTAWVYAQIFPGEIGLIKEGQQMEAVAVAIPGKKYRGKIKSLDTLLDSETRTLKVRAVVENTEGLLKPDMYVDVVIHAELGKVLAIPESAVLETGIRKIVFVKDGEGIFTPKEISTGRQTDDYYEVLRGIKEGEEVVTSANFLIDSESKIKAAISKVK